MGFLLKFTRWGILQKILATSAVSALIIAAAILLYFLPAIERNALDLKKDATRNVVEVAYATIAAYGEKAQSGQMPLEEAQKRAAADIGRIRYQGNEYFWINDLAPKMIMHPIKPELDGKDLSENKDPAGKLLFMEFVRVAREKGGGFVDYLWPKPGSSTPVPKVSYVKLYQPWGWIVGSGVYIDDIRRCVGVLRYGIIAMTVVVTLITLFMGLIVGLGITRAIRRVAVNLKNIAHGDADLTQRLPVGKADEIGDLARSFNGFMEKMHDIISHVTATTTDLTYSVTQLHRETDRLAGHINDMAAETGSVATAGEEMAATSNEIAGNCIVAADSSQHARSAAVAGADAVRQAVHVMQDIAGRVKDSARSVEELGARSDEIGAIIGTIEDIADQTNLLALNAAIEAARAGEQGRGFAVVADEVRALAERTTKATREIGTMIKSIQDQTRQAVKMMDDGVAVVATGMSETSGSEKLLQDILDQVNSLSMQVSQIATAAEEQSATTVEISKSIHQVTDTLSASVGGVKESAATASKLSLLAQKLQDEVRNFRINGSELAIIDLARNDHVMFVRRIWSILNGQEKLRAEELADHHGCRFGKWYDTDGKRLCGNMESFRAVDAPHQKIHAVAKEAVAAFNNGDREKAERLYHELEEISNVVVSRLGEIKSECGRKK